ncbi:sce7725 family protein [Sphingomonas sp. H39-1-10]|uniref:sce7725 family protein n=1 Tax=Sphingomonas pollutisoli TaxID=3030829 RepID=UPI0023B8D217|nr:sce7725 family protein [Sphingomonas pollutisoli]MDF0490708.1 sce7725 family protein [Sphingomonas pollutisoli]
MYHPFFRGKQYELLTIRENAPLLARSNFIPIIEPVKEAVGGLDRALSAVRDAGGRAIVIVNPHHGEHGPERLGISTMLRERFSGAGIMPAILLKEDTTVDQAVRCFNRHAHEDVVFIHGGFTQAAALTARLSLDMALIRHVFVDGKAPRLYRRHFTGPFRVLVRDGFEKRKNSAYPAIEAFSDLHVTYPDEGMTGFGDFLTVGDEFSESGGPAYAVVIHLTFINSLEDDTMLIHHFLSHRRDTPTDPAGKFLEALGLLMEALRQPGCPIYETGAVMEFRDLHMRNHFPGLGYAKKLSMQHHIETLAQYLRA